MGHLVVSTHIYGHLIFLYLQLVQPFGKWKGELFMAYRDIGEMFIKFMLSEEVRSFYEVDVTNVITEQEWERYRS